MSDPYVLNTTTVSTAPAELWRQAVAAITKDGQEILRKVAEARKIFRGNKLDALIAATADDEAVRGTTMSGTQARAWLALISIVTEFKDSEVSPGFTVEDGLYAMWPIVSPTPEG
ncbi:MAG: hypothetical protein HGA45_36750 [Chloroflexales bacterium]|nr:hypothetical protein [Chloroflexales bacterium]